MNKRISSMLLFAILTTSSWLNPLWAQTFETRVSSYGLALPKDNVTLRSNIDSRIARILVEEGQFVKKGQLLIELDCETAMVKQEIARLAANELGRKMEAEAESRFAKTNYETLKSLFDRKAVNEKELNEARLRWERAAAQVKIAQETIATNHARFLLASSELKEHFLTAPFDGQIVDLKVGAGSAVTTDTDIAHIIALNELRVDLYLDFKQYGKFNVGDRCRLKLADPFGEKEIDAVVTYLSPMVEATSGTRRVSVSIDNRDLKLPAGITVTISDSNFLE